MPGFSPVFIIWVHPFGHCQDAYALLIKGMGGFITIWAAPPRGIAIWRSTSVSLQLPRVEHRPGCKVRLLQLTAFECWFHFVLGVTTWNMLRQLWARGLPGSIFNQIANFASRRQSTLRSTFHRRQWIQEANRVLRAKPREESTSFDLNGYGALLITSFFFAIIIFAFF
uniref:Uncharacterized protein n=1 Tax=Opuntia streptacantha TaxID=393608 RepID=A0A7C8YRB8_OPUST